MLPEIVIKHAPWSYSKADSALSCPFLYHQQYVEKHKPEGAVNLPMEVGNVAHRIVELALKGLPVDTAFDRIVAQGNLLYEVQVGVQIYREAIEDFVKGYETFQKTQGVTKTHVEAQLGFTADLKPAGFFDNDNCLFRGKVDVLALLRNKTAIVIDHKTGMPKPIRDHARQFEVYSVLTVVNFPEVTSVRGAVHNMKADKNKKGTRTDWAPEYPVEAVQGTVWNSIVEWLTKAGESAETQEPRKSWKCKNCVYKPMCPLFK
jgi:hypothetical protein